GEHSFKVSRAASQAAIMDDIYQPIVHWIADVTGSCEPQSSQRPQRDLKFFFVCFVIFVVPGVSSQCEFHHLEVPGKTVAGVEGGAPRGRPQDHAIHAVLSGPGERRLQQPRADAATDGGRDVHIRYVAVALLLHYRVGDLRDRTEPHVADDAAFGDSNPGAPRLCGELAAHPFSAAADERFAIFGRRGTAGAELPPQLREVGSIGRRGRAYVNHRVTCSHHGEVLPEMSRPRPARQPTTHGRRRTPTPEP